MRSQKRIPGLKRNRIGSSVIREIEERVTLIAIQNDVSKSFVMAVALADYFGITKQEKFNESGRNQARTTRKTPRNRPSSTNDARTH